MLIAALTAALCTPAVRPADPPADAGAVRVQLESVLSEMERAVLAADAHAYIRCVDPAEPRFHKEQENWAAELRKHKPTAFDLGIADETDAAFTTDRAAFRLVMTYSIDAGHAAALPLGATASWPAVFRSADPDGDGPEPRRWLYAGENWRQVGRPGFTVMYFPGAEETVEHVIEAFPAARAHVNEGFQIDLRDHQVIKLYDDMEHLKATVYLSMPDAVLGGWNEPGESIKFLTRYGHDTRSWTRAFAHEYGHVATWAMGDRMRESPWWVHEGVAELSAEAFDHNGKAANDQMIRALAGRGGLADWSEIADYQTAAPEKKMLAYYQGHHFIGYISGRWGRDGRNAWLRRLGAGEGLDPATRAQFGLSFDELDAAWRETLK